MSVPEGTLTDEYRARVLEFYERVLGWREITSLRRPDRLTISVGGVDYVNVREQAKPMVGHGYEHFGVILPTAADLRQLWADLAADPLDVELEELATSSEGEGSFRFSYLLPMAVEAQYYAQLLDNPAR
jgi:catechol-2,3-dioxygenase